MYHEITRHSISELSPFVKQFLTKDMLLFDIETTGLSPARCSVYCIGCGFLEGDEVIVELFFAHAPAEEGEILKAFLHRLQPFSTVITFNGSTFDIPFLEKRMHLTGYSPFAVKDSLDLYKEVRKMKEFLDLPSLRQKSIEAFLGCAREDRYDGGQLIEIYKLYASGCSVDRNNHTVLLAWDGDEAAGRLSEQQAKELLSALLLHNREDVWGMFFLLDILSYRQLAQGRFEVTEVSRDGEALVISLTPHAPFPRHMHRVVPEASFAIHEERALLMLPLKQGELKHFFANVCDYYYLPAEDAAVHKSVGVFVDPAHRKKATRQTSYVKKECKYEMIP